MRKKTIKSIVMTSAIAVMLGFGYTTANAQNYKVIIDPGHGGKDNGSAYNGYLEDSMNLEIAQNLKQKLENEGINVEITRNDDTYLSLSKRTEISNKSNADLFISIHQNASINQKANGVETYYMGEDNKQLANIIQENIIEKTNANDRGVRNKNLQVLRDNQKTAVLIECGFISNNSEAYRLNTYKYKEKIVKGISQGIKNYFNINESKNVKSSNNKISTNNKIENNNYTNAVVLNDVNVMSDRGKNFKVLGKLEKGTKVEVIDTKFDWHKIVYKNSVGYVSGVYVK